MDLFEIARQKVQAPAILLLVAGVLNGLLSMSAIVAGFGVLKQSDGRSLYNLGPEEGVIGIVSLLIAVFICFGAVCMRNLRYFGLSFASSILALIPCCGGICWIVSLPAGIWALIVLSNSEVKEAFR